MPYMTADNMKPIVDDILKRQREGRAQEYHVPFVIESLAVYADKGMQHRPAEGVVDTLTEQCGRLYSRNKSLTKGHATLTRRVQELEQELAYYRQKYPRTMTFGDDGLTIKEGEHVRVTVGKLTDHPLKAVQEEMRAEKEPPIPPLPSAKQKGDFIRSLSRGIQGCEPRELRINAMNALHELANAVDGIEPEQKQVVFQAPSKESLNEEADQLLEAAMESLRDSKLFEDLRAEQQNRQAAETQLALTVAEINERLSNIEFAASAGHYNLDTATEGQVLASESFNAAVRQQLIMAVAPGGVLSTALRK